MNNIFKIPYIVQWGDTLYSIAEKFNTGFENLINLNQLTYPFLIAGQKLFIPIEAIDMEKSRDMQQKEYKAVTAYTATLPVIVNGTDINTGLYPVLNYKPTGAQYPYIYVPIAKFSKVGAKVSYDEVSQIVSVNTDYYELKNKMDLLIQENQYLSTSIENSVFQYQGNTAANIKNGGYIGRGGDWLYYSFKPGAFYLYNQLIKMKTDGTGRINLNDDDPDYINVINDWVYYRSGFDNGKIYRVKSDGTNRMKLNEDSSTDLIVFGDYIYYLNQSDNSKLYKMKLDGKDKIKLNDDQSASINVTCDWIYYQNISDNQSLYKIRKDGTERTKISNISLINIIVNGDWIYYINISDEHKVYKMRLDGTDNVKLSDSYTERLNLSKEWIYFTVVTSPPGGELYKMKLDGSGITDLKVDSVTDIEIFGEWIYYRLPGRNIYKIKTDGTEKQSL